MKLFTIILLMIMSFAPFSQAQETARNERLNSMSNVFGVTAEGGLTLGTTDYSVEKTNYTGKLSIEYYLPSAGNANFGFRIFGQHGILSGRNPQPSFENPTNSFATQIDLFGGGIFFNIAIADIVYPWIALGGSNLWFQPRDANGNKLPNYAEGVYNNLMLTFNGDAGLRFMVSKSLSINLAGGLILGGSDYPDDIKAGPGNDIIYTASLGLSFYFGRQADSDGDGVPNSRDMCPGTAPAAKVDDNGCPLDTDSDGVADYLDKSPDTRRGVKVDAEGRPLDSDGDAVADYLDKCPGTPGGVTVDAAGCPVDSDGDHVADYIDKCPNTPEGVQVNAEGCPLIAKKDTVIIRQPAEIKSFVLRGDANFESGKADLLPNAYTLLDSLASTMKMHAEYIWEVGGHTDARGSDETNRVLSQRRAQSVVDYLVSRGVNSGNIRIFGYGENSPIASNATAEGRAMNRRVEIKLISKGR